MTEAIFRHSLIALAAGALIFVFAGSPVSAQGIDFPVMVRSLKYGPSSYLKGKTTKELTTRKRLQPSTAKMHR